jgi:Pyridoxamine 5'-phosphate oxidase
MTAHVTSHDLRADPPPPRLDLDWGGALRAIADTETYLVSTVPPDCTPHVVPVLGVWVDDQLTFNTDEKARKARNLQANRAITVSAPAADYDFTIEGIAHRVTDEAALHRVAAAFSEKYAWWHPYVRQGHFYADESAAPRAVIAVQARNVFGFGKASGFTATRWSLSARG